MLSAQGNLHLSPYSDLYDLIVPKDNQFRQFKELCNDFDFIYDNGPQAILSLYVPAIQLCTSALLSYLFSGT